MNCLKYTLAATSLALLAACGGGGGGGGGESGSSVGEAQGAYEGTSTFSGNTKSIQLLILEDDSFWMMYGTSKIEGFIQGQGTGNNGTFVSNNVKDFYYKPSYPLTISSTYSTSSNTISGTASGASGTLSFSAGPLSSSSLYTYNKPANINEITGSWQLTALGGANFSTYISNAGAFGFNVNGCTLSGSLAPRSSGKNVFNLTITEGASPCPSPGNQYSGIALSVPTKNGSTKLSITYINSDRTLGGAVFGVR